MTRQHAKDRRVQRTEHRLREALGLLIHEKNYDAIAVKEILDRANVGRSAFYAHFPDKDGLLASSIQRILLDGSPRQPSASVDRFHHVVWFSLPVFEHIDRFRRSAAASMGAKSRAIVHRHLRRVLVDKVEDAVSETRPSGSVRIPPALLARYVVGTFMVVLEWWIESNRALSAQEVDGVFRRMVLPTLAAVVIDA